MLSSDTYNHILKFLGQYIQFGKIYKDLFLLGDHGHVRFWLGEVRLDQVRVSFLNDSMGLL